MRLRANADVVTQHALIVGAVTDALTNEPTRAPPRVELLRSFAPDDERALALPSRVDERGRFVFSGTPRAIPAPPEGIDTLDFCLRVSADGYQSASQTFTLSRGDLALTEETIEFEGVSYDVMALDAPLVELSIALAPEPVHLSGAVVNADEPDQPVADAEVRVTAPEPRGPVGTNANGLFTLAELPVAVEIEVEVSHPDFEPLGADDRVIALDYRSPINVVRLAVEPTPP